MADDPKLLQEGDDFDMDLEGDFDAGPREAPDVGDVTLRSAVESTRSPEAADTPAEVSDALEDVLGSPDTATTSAPDKSVGKPAPAMSKPDRAAGVASVAQVDRPPQKTPPESNKTAMARGYRRQKAELERAAAESETAQKREPEPQAAATVETPALERLRAAEVEDLEALEAWLDSKKKDPGPQARLDEAHRRLRAADKAAGATEPGSATAEQIATIKALHEITPTHGGEIQVRDSAGMSRKEAREAIARRADTATLNPPFDSNLLSLGRDAVRPRLLKLSEFLGDASSPVSPNPPKDTDGRREDSGRGVRELQGRWPGLHWGRWEVGGRSSVAAQGPYGRLRELRCAGWRENTQQGTLADRGGASLRGRWVSCSLAVRPGVEWLAAGPRRE